MLTDFDDFWYAASWRNLTLVDCKFAHLTWENVTQYLAKYKVVHKFESTLFSWLWKEPVVLCGKITGSNATESVQSDHPVHGHTLPVVSAIGQWPHPWRCVVVQPTSEQAAAEKWLFWHSPGTVATVCGWGGHLQPSNVKFLQDLVCQKWLKSVYFWRSYSKNKNVIVFWDTVYTHIIHVV